MCNWGISRPYDSLSDQDHASVLTFITLLMKLGIVTEFDANYFLLEIGSPFRIQDPKYSRHLDLADEISRIIEGSIRRKPCLTPK